MVAANHNFIVEKGADIVWTLAASNSGGAHVDHTGYTVEMDVRDNFDSASTLLTLTSGNGRVSIDGSGDIVFTLVGSDTAALTFDKGVYDVKVTDTSNLSNFYLRGQFIVKKTVTR